MFDFKAFMEKGNFLDIVIQMSLREIDAETLARALVDQDEAVREIVFRNMSERAVTFLKEDLRNLTEAEPESILAGQELFASLLEKNAELFAKRGMAALEDELEPPLVDLGSRDSIIASFCALARFSKDHGLLSLEKLQYGTDNPLMRTGLMMLIEGWEPALLHSILEKNKVSYLRAKEIEYDLIIEGIDSLADEDNYLITEQRLQALVAGL